MMSRFLDPAIADQLLHSSNIDLRAVERDICFAVIQFYPANVPELRDMHASAAEISKTFGAVVETFLSHIVIVSFGALPGRPRMPHMDFINAVLASHISKVKIAYACGLARTGSIGGPKRLNLSFIHPAFPRVLAELNTMPLGEAHKVHYPKADG